MKRLLWISIGLLIASIASATGVVEVEPESGGIEVTDSTGTLFSFDSAPTRVVSAAPSITETIYALGMEDVLIARTNFCDFPAEVEELPSIGSIRQPSLELIVELEPDVVIASTHFQPEAANTLADVGIPVVYLYNPGSFDGVYSKIETIGTLLGADDAASSLTTEMRADVDEVLEIVTGATTRPSVYYVVGFGQGGDFTAGGDTFIGEMLDMVNVANIAAESSGWAFSLEQIVEANPDIVIASKYFDARQGLETTDGYKDLPAIVEGRLFEFDNNTVDRQGPRLAQGLRELATIVHPDLF